MPRAPRPLALEDLKRLDTSLIILRHARSMLKKAGALKAARAAQRAINSTEGAIRHAYGARSRLREAS